MNSKRCVGWFKWVTRIAACTVIVSTPLSAQASAKPLSERELSKLLAGPSRPQADRDQDANRKPAQLLAYLGVAKGMVALDVFGFSGYMTETLSMAVGSEGKVYVQNPPALLQLRDGEPGKALAARLANNRLPNVVRVDGYITAEAVIPNSVDVAITVMNLHDVYTVGGVPAATALMKSVFNALKPGGVFGVVDHVGNESANNSDLHRMTKQQALDLAKAGGFVVEAESDMFKRAGDDHTKTVFDPSIRGKTDRFFLRLRKPN